MPSPRFDTLWFFMAILKATMYLSTSKSQGTVIVGLGLIVVGWSKVSIGRTLNFPSSANLKSMHPKSCGSWVLRMGIKTSWAYSLVLRSAVQRRGLGGFCVAFEHLRSSSSASRSQYIQMLPLPVVGGYLGDSAESAEWRPVEKFFCAACARHCIRQALHMLSIVQATPSTDSIC